MNLSTDIRFSNNLIENRTCTITYSGFLFKNNSDIVSIVYGFNDGWENTTEQEMTKTENGFTTQLRLLDFENLNFCFKNSNNEWDNNNNFNYSAPISEILEENFIINEDILDNILDNIFNCDLSEMTRENLVYSSTQETTTEAIENITPENLFDNIEDSIVNEDFSIDFSQTSNFDMDSFVDDILSPITQASVLPYSSLNDEENNNIEAETITLNNEENNNIETESIALNNETNDVTNDQLAIEKSSTDLVDNQTTNIEKNEITTFSNEQNTLDLEEDKKIDNLIDNLINNLYEKANSTDETSEINIIDDNTTSIIDTNLEEVEKTNSSENIIDALISKITTEDISNVPGVEEIVDNNISTTNTEFDVSEKNETTTTDIEESLFENISTDIPKIKQHSETALIETTDNFIVSSKSLSKFYMMRKKIKLAFYKLMALPKIIFGSNEN